MIYLVCLEYPRTEVEWHVQIPAILRSRIVESERDRPAGVCLYEIRQVYFITHTHIHTHTGCMPFVKSITLNLNFM
jgi:hypothetical protein